MPSGTGQPQEGTSTASARRWPSPVRRTAADRAELGFLIFVTLAAVGGSYGAMIALGNFHAVVPQRIYRSGQPTPEQLRAWVDRYGLKTIVNLRGPTAPGAAQERTVAASLGVEVICLELSAYKRLSGRKLVQLLDVLQTAKQPMLLHCFHGVDRAGTAAALAAWLLGGRPYERARWQAYVPPGPWKRFNGSGHISDVLTRYEDFCRTRGVSPDNPSLFQHWAREIYSARDSPVEPGALCDEDTGRPRDPGPTR
ncbi:MAG: tyrosine-protein phosphatase [Planctomycetes bacterium]|nr:tyrosine-protein phosphatase [Planctomycetota bacterium]